VTQAGVSIVHSGGLTVQSPLAVTLHGPLETVHSGGVIVQGGHVEEQSGPRVAVQLGLMRIQSRVLV